MRSPAFGVALLLGCTIARMSAGAALSMQLTLGAAEARTDELRFSGTPMRGGVLQSVELRGRQLGLVRPALVDLAAHVDGGFHHVALGVLVGFLGAGHPQGGVTFPASSVGTLSGVYFGPEAATVWSVKRFDVRAGLSLGYRRYMFPLTSFDPIVCGRSGTIRCAPDVDADGFFLRPTLALGGHFGSLCIGIYGGGDVMPGGSWNTGAYVSFESKRWREQAAVKRYD
jgi:hypothetical protein